MSIPSELVGASASHMLAPSSPADERTRVLKHADTFAVFDHYGDIRPGGLGEQGLYHDGTRFLSCLLLELDGRRPFFLSSTVRDENDQLTVSLTNPDLIEDGRVRLPLARIRHGRNGQRTGSMPSTASISGNCVSSPSSISRPSNLGRLLPRYCSDF